MDQFGHLTGRRNVEATPMPVPSTAPSSAKTAAARDTSQASHHIIRLFRQVGLERGIKYIEFFVIGDPRIKYCCLYQNHEKQRCIIYPTSFNLSPKISRHAGISSSGTVNQRVQLASLKILRSSTLYRVAIRIVQPCNWFSNSCSKSDVLIITKTLGFSQDSMSSLPELRTHRDQTDMFGFEECDQLSPRRQQQQQRQPLFIGMLV